MSFLLLVAESMLKTFNRSDFPIDCQYGNHLKYPTVVANVIGCLVILLSHSHTELKNNAGNNKCASPTNKSLFLISDLNGQTDRKYVFFL